MSKRRDVTPNPKVESLAEDHFPQPDVSAGPREDQATPTAASHPEEMNAGIDVRIGNCVAIKASARATPAGLAAVALVVAAALIPVIWLTKPARHRH
jgi:hypothetical protein